MAPSRTRAELVDSFRLLGREELWLFAGLGGGAVGYLIWIAGTGVAVGEFVRALADALPVDSDSVELWVLAALWVLVPSFVAVRYVVDHLTNLRGNVEQCYRFEQPLVLLGPPAVFLLGALVVAAVRGRVGPVTLIALGAANIVLLVRTVAYGYRVYSLSVPRALQALLFLAALAVSLGVVCRTASLAGQEALVESTVARYGLGGDVAVGSASVPLLGLVGATAPGIVAVSYVWVQVFASLIVRIRRPDVPRSAIRAGQRYPQVVQPGTDRRLAMGTVPEEGDGTEESDSGSGAGAGSGGASGPGSGDGSAGHPGSPAGEAAGTDGGPEASPGGPDDEDHRFGETRVYTPPEDEDGGTVKSELCPICGETYAADAGYTNCPNCNAVIESDEGHS